MNLQLIMIKSDLGARKITYGVSGIDFEQTITFRDANKSVISRISPSIKRKYDVSDIKYSSTYTDLPMESMTVYSDMDYVYRTGKDSNSVMYTRTSISEIVSAIEKLKNIIETTTDRLHALEVAAVNISSNTLEDPTDAEAVRLKQIKEQYSELHIQQ